MSRRKMTQVELAKAMRASRTVVHRLLDPHDTSVPLATLAKASKALKVRRSALTPSEQKLREGRLTRAGTAC